MSNVRKSELFDLAVYKIDIAARVYTSGCFTVKVTLKEEFTGNPKKFNKILKRIKLEKCEHRLKEKYANQYNISSTVDRQYAGYYIGRNQTFDRVVWQLKLEKL